MRILHTSDWHLGCSLFGKKRYTEQESFLLWLAELIQTEQVDIVLVGGDVFDSPVPSHRAQELYYDFLHQVSRSTSRHIVIIGGNHDSPSLLNAPAELLKHLNIHVRGAMTESLKDEVIVLKDEAGTALAVVCAVPFLRERDLRLVEAGEASSDKEDKLAWGIKNHYQGVFDQAFLLAKDAPVIAMGHLFAAGASLKEGEAVRELYIGNLARIPGGIFPDELAYTALGHLHRQQSVGARENLRYSGSPIPLSFTEAESPKLVLVVDILDRQSRVRAVEVPQKVRLCRIEGDWDKISAELQSLAFESLPCWLDVNYNGADIRPQLKQDILELIADEDIELLRLRNERITQKALSPENLTETLDDLDPQEVFRRCLELHKIEEDLAIELQACYNEILQDMAEQDANAD